MPRTAKPAYEITRTLRGKKYVFDTCFPTKQMADKYAAGARENGKLAIVLLDKEDEWYNVLVHKKR